MDLFNKNKYLNLVNSAIMNLESCLIHRQMKMMANKVPQNLEMASIFNAGAYFSESAYGNIKTEGESN